MKNIHILTLALLGLTVVSTGHAESDANANKPCKQIKAACEAAGFVKGQAKAGTGLWVDCIDPIMQSKPQPAKAKIALPSVDSAVVNACKAKHPNWGQGHKKNKA